jgi:hypothetical protein
MVMVEKNRAQFIHEIELFLEEGPPGRELSRPSDWWEGGRLLATTVTRIAR